MTMSISIHKSSQSKYGQALPLAIVSNGLVGCKNALVDNESDRKYLMLSSYLESPSNLTKSY